MTTIIGLLSKEFGGKRVKLEKDIWTKAKGSERIFLYEGLVTGMGEIGDKYCGFMIHFVFEGGIEYSIDNSETLITIIE